MACSRGDKSEMSSVRLFKRKTANKSECKKSRLWLTDSGERREEGREKGSKFQVDGRKRCASFTAGC